MSTAERLQPPTIKHKLWHSCHTEVLHQNVLPFIQVNLIELFQKWLEETLDYFLRYLCRDQRFVPFLVEPVQLYLLSHAVTGLSLQLCLTGLEVPTWTVIGMYFISVWYER